MPLCAARVSDWVGRESHVWCGCRGCWADWIGYCEASGKERSESRYLTDQLVSLWTHGHIEDVQMGETNNTDLDVVLKLFGCTDVKVLATCHVGPPFEVTQGNSVPKALVGPSEAQGALGACYDEGRPLVCLDPISQKSREVFYKYQS